MFAYIFHKKAKTIDIKMVLLVKINITLEQTYYFRANITSIPNITHIIL